MPNRLNHTWSILNLILEIEKSLMVGLLKHSQNSISLVKITVVEALSHSSVVLGVLISLDDLHFNERHLVARASAEHT